MQLVSTAPPDGGCAPLGLRVAEALNEKAPNLRTTGCQTRGRVARVSGAKGQAAEQTTIGGATPVDAPVAVPGAAPVATSDAAPVTKPGSVGIRFERVSKTFGVTGVLHEIDLVVRPGELVALLGPSGCGKTTLLRIAAGLEAPDAGRVVIGETDMAQVPPERRDLGVVFQAASLFGHLSVAKNVAFGLRMRRVGAAERAERVSAALELVGLRALADRLPHTLSGGQQQRVALARALVTRPRALLLDEPLSALDASERERLREEIRSIQRELCITTLFVTHDQDEAMSMADRAAVMRAGRIEQVDEPEVLYRMPATPFVAGFIGETNRLAGEVVGSSVRVCGGRVVLPLVHPAADVAAGDASSLAVGAAHQQTGTAMEPVQVTVFVRPEHVRVTAGESVVRETEPTGGSRTPGKRDAIGGVVCATSFLGASARTDVLLDTGETVAVRHDPAEQRLPGERVAVDFTGEPVAIEPR